MTSLLLAVALAQAVTPELRQHVEAGMKARAAGDLDTAIGEFRRVTELAPGLAAAHVNLGSVYLQKKDYANSIAPLRKALSLNPDLPGAHQMLGTALLAVGAPADAIPHLEKSQSNDLLGIALYESGRAREAVDKLEAALLQQAGDADLLYYLGQAHATLAQSVFDRLRAQTSPAASARTQQMLGHAAMAANRREEAEKHFRAVLAARPDMRGIHLALGELYLAAGDFVRAEREFRAEAALTASSAPAAYKLGLALANLGRHAEAATELDRAFHLQPDMPEASLELGKALAASGKLEDAAIALERVTKLEPDSALAEAAHLQLSLIYRRLGRAAEAGKALDQLQLLRRKRKK